MFGNLDCKNFKIRLKVIGKLGEERTYLGPSAWITALNVRFPPVVLIT